jgi:hypothetical protein
MVPLLHVGYPKTGSTWLQNHVFDHHGLGLASVARSVIHDQLARVHPLVFDVAACRATFDPFIRSIQGRGLTPVVSSERLSGDTFDGGLDSLEQAERLVRVFPQAKILVVVREQRSMIYSLYKHFVRAGFPGSLRTFLQRPNRGMGYLRWFDYEHLEYDRFAERYAALFGRPNVLVLAFEEFCREPLAFTARLLQFMGITAEHAAMAALPFAERDNEGLQPVGVALQRPLNWLCVRHRLNPWPPLPSKWLRGVIDKAMPLVDRCMPRRGQESLRRKQRRLIAEFVRDRYRASNARLAAAHALPLGEFGYDVAETTAARAA